MRAVSAARRLAEEAALRPPRRFRGDRYWQSPLPGFGDPRPRSLHRRDWPRRRTAATGPAGCSRATNRATSCSARCTRSACQSARVDRPGDGLALTGALVAAAVSCAPPDNRPLPYEFANCREYLYREIRALRAAPGARRARRLAFECCLGALAASGAPVPRPKPRFAHGGESAIGADRLFATYHPSQQNTYTGRLTQPMLRAVLRRASREAASLRRARLSDRLPVPTPSR